LIVNAATVSSAPRTVIILIGLKSSLDLFLDDSLVRASRMWIFLSVPKITPSTISPLDRNSIMPKDKAQNQKNATKDRQMMGSVGDLLTENEKLLSVAGAELPDCFEGCNKYFAKTVDVAIKSGNHYERYQNVCFRFKEARKCLEQMKHCGSYELFDVLTSGLKYMCMDQKGAFNATMECVDVNTSEIQDSK
uniref:Chondroitin proteoglycan 4 (inferred by orthology to a C. elegans protein) n=1 Tax=Anisakis simplex TaxID=6269 RepID=A0A0M3J226_ANISI